MDDRHEDLDEKERVILIIPWKDNLPSCESRSIDFCRLNDRNKDLSINALLLLISEYSDFLTIINFEFVDVHKR